MDSDQKKKSSPQKSCSSVKGKQSTYVSTASSQGVHKKSNPVSGLSLKLYRVTGT